MSNRPKWADRTVRDNSEKREKKLANLLSGKKTVNSGATFTENDIKTASLDIEHKYTDASQFILKLETFEQTKRRTSVDKIPIMVVEFTKDDSKKVVIDFDDFMSIFEGD